MNRLSQNTIEVTRREWRELGFFYLCDDNARRWRLTGSVQGLLRFAEIAEEYSTNRSFAPVSEHEHIGPHMYLELMTSDKPGIDGHSIHGSQQDIARLAKLVRAKLQAAKPGDQIVISAEYDPAVEYSVVLDVRDDSYDPASEDPQLVDS
jgi:hypothetical protein